MLLSISLFCGFCHYFENIVHCNDSVFFEYSKHLINNPKKKQNKTMTTNIGDITVNVKKGNLAAEMADCLVVPQFNSCASYGGVGRAIAFAGMEEGLVLYDKAVNKHTLPFASVLITDSGKAGVKLAHAVTVGAKDDQQFCVVQQAMLSILLQAKRHGIRTIAVPEIGTGIIGCLTPEQSAKAIFSAVHTCATMVPNHEVEEITLVIYGGSTESAERVLTEKSYINVDDKEVGQKEFDLGKFITEMGLC